MSKINSDNAVLPYDKATKTHATYYNSILQTFFVICFHFTIMFTDYTLHADQQFVVPQTSQNT